MKAFIGKLGFDKVPSNSIVPDLPDDDNDGEAAHEAATAAQTAAQAAAAEAEATPVPGVEEQSRIKRLLHADSTASPLQTKPLTPLGERWLAHHPVRDSQTGRAGLICLRAKRLQQPRSRPSCRRSCASLLSASLPRTSSCSSTVR